MKPMQVDGRLYHLVALCIRKEDAIYVDLDVKENDKRVARFRLRCAEHEVQYATLRQSSDSEISELAASTITPDRVRQALWFESELRKLNPESPVNGVLGAIFPETNRNGTHP